MPYKECDYLTTPADATILWRYMDFTKFVSLLDKQALFFASIASFQDPFEGSLPVANMEAHKDLGQRMAGGQLHSDDPEELRRLEKELERPIGLQLQEARRSVLVNCWHESPLETEFMWKVYAHPTETSGNGVAIETDCKSLKESFICEAPIYITQVQYVDKTSFISEYKLLLCSHKRKSFEPEREVRAMTDLGDRAEAVGGVHYKVDLSKLIKKVLVAPYAKDWFMELVQSTAKRYSLNIRVCKSDLGNDPIWSW